MSAPGRPDAVRLVAPLVLGLAGIAVLLALGVWQLRRLDWKEAILTRIETRIAAAPVPLPAAPDPAADEYLAVAASGTIGTPELHVLVSLKQVGPGWRIVVPFQTDGRRVLLDRGFVPDGQQDASRRGGPAEVTGNLHWPDDRGSSTPPNDEAGNIWFARDLPDMARALDTEPILLVARSDTGEGIRPIPVGTEGIPNDHLQYAITWFSLAAVWAGMTALWLWRITRRTDRGPAT
jgi:surfeit locus 1 family protein